MIGVTKGLLISIRVDERRWEELPVDIRELCDSAVRASFASASQRAYGEVSVLLTNDLAMSEFNSQYRGQGGPTNVLAFCAASVPVLCDFGAEPVLWGDIVISIDRAEDEARSEAKSINDHIAHLVVHGTLHLLGFDHKEAREAASMEKLETVSLGRLGVGNPYAIAANQGVLHRE